MRSRRTEVAGRISLWLAGLFTVAGASLSVVNIFLAKPIEFPPGLLVTYLFGTLASFIGYVYGRMEANVENQEILLRQRGQGVEVFHTSEDFLKKLVDITLEAESVSTLNLSPARGQHADLDYYFQRVHAYIKARRTPLQSFRSIASIDDNSKLDFLVARSLELSPTGRASFAVFAQEAPGPFQHPLSVHITIKQGRPQVFLFPPVNLTGAMDSVLIRDEAVAKVMLDYFNILWHKSVVLSEGKRIRVAGLNHLARMNPLLRQNQHFRQLEEIAT